MTRSEERPSAATGHDRPTAASRPRPQARPRWAREAESLPEPEVLLHLRLNDEERHLFEDAAAVAGVSTQEWARRVLVETSRLTLLARLPRRA